MTERSGQGGNEAVSPEITVTPAEKCIELDLDDLRDLIDDALSDFYSNRSSDGLTLLRYEVKMLTADIVESAIRHCRKSNSL